MTICAWNLRRQRREPHNSVNSNSSLEPCQTEHQMKMLEDNKAFLQAPPTILATFSDLLFENCQTGRSSTYCCGKEGGAMVATVNGSKLGQVQCFLKHKMKDVHVWCKVSWFTNPQKDEDSGLWFAEEAVETDTLLRVKEISLPLITAREDDKIWFLNIT